MVCCSTQLMRFMNTTMILMKGPSRGVVSSSIRFLIWRLAMFFNTLTTISCSNSLFNFNCFCWMSSARTLPRNRILTPKLINLGGREGINDHWMENIHIGVPVKLMSESSNLVEYLFAILGKIIGKRRYLLS